eukprot:TRINITY_DN848_c0_g1_i1.p1 TRINITY_DN848_c0_g1~~TRINITY_DN848_c0_g1_i1.p1  ORF type:complete len:1089 (-),score=323.39 TRINITY_DN848_c0_g1_i1:272-3538(-)
MYNYVVSAHKPTAVSHALTCAFTGTTHRNLVVAKGTRLEVHTLTPDGLAPLADLNLYGRVSSLLAFRPSDSSTDWIFLATEDYNMCVLAYDTASLRICTKARGDLRDRIGKPTKVRQIATVDPGGRAIGLHLYNGLFKVLPLDPESGALHDAFNIRFEESNVLDLSFLDGAEEPTLLVLYQDSSGARHVKTYVVRMAEKEFEPGPWQQSHVEKGTNMLVPVPAPFGGALMLGESMLTYANGSKVKTIAFDRPCIMKAFGRVDADGQRVLLGDFQGEMHVAVLTADESGAHVVDVAVQPLGVVAIPTAIAYLDNGFVFVGSALGDSQLVRLLPEPDPSGAHLQVVSTFCNLGPIVDFVVVDLDRQGQGKIVTCSGAYKDGSLRVIRNGIGLHVLAEIDMENVCGTWPLVANAASSQHSILALSFVSQTQFLFIDTLEMKEIAGLEHEQQSLYCGDASDGHLVQVTRSGVRLAHPSSGLAAHWKPPSGEITVVCASELEMCLSYGDGHVCLLDISNGSIQVVAERDVGQQVSSIAFNGGAEASGDGRASVCAVAYWKELSVTLLELPSFRPLHTEPLGLDVMARSLLLTRFEGLDYLLCGLGDGNLLTYTMDGHKLSRRKAVSLGTQPVSLNKFQTKDGSHVIAACDRPTVIYSSNRKLLFSNVNMGEVRRACPFDAASYPQCMLLVTHSNLTIGRIDDVQKLHVRTIPLREMPRRIAYQASSDRYCVLSVRFEFSDGQEQEKHMVHVLDGTTMDIVCSHELKEGENVCSVASASFEGDSSDYFVVGTADVVPGEPEPRKGRILVFRCEGASNKLLLVAQRDVGGAVFALSAFQGRLLATINGKVQLYSWGADLSGGHELHEEASHEDNIVALHLATRGDFILVGDLMRSISLLSYSPVDNSIQEMARDFNPNWMTAVEALDDDTFIGAESCFNLFTVRKNADAATDEERGRMELVGEFHLGDYVNRFRHGSLVMRMPDHQSYPTLLFGTISGAVGVVVSLPQKEYEFFKLVQTEVTKIIKGIGGFEHAQWRAFCNERKQGNASKNFIDGDLLESVLDLAHDRIAEVATAVGVPPDELVSRIEALSQATH